MLFLRIQYTLQIYTIESNMESVARHILLLTLALEPKELMGIQGINIVNIYYFKISLKVFLVLYLLLK